MNFLQGFSPRSITMTGGLLAACAAVIAQATTTDTTVETGSFLLGSAGLIAAISAFAKDYWSDRQRQRDHEAALLRIKFGHARAGRALTDLYHWARESHAAVPALPPAPELHLEVETEPKPE